MLLCDNVTKIFYIDNFSDVQKTNRKTYNLSKKKNLVCSVSLASREEQGKTVS